MTNFLNRMRGRDDQGMTLISLVLYIAVGAVIMAGIFTLISVIVSQSRITQERTETTTAVQEVLEELSNTIDESAGIFHATETELGVARNVTSDTSGLTQCYVDYYWVGTDGGGDALRHGRDILDETCRDSYDWPDTSLQASDVSLSDLMPYTLVDATGLGTASCDAVADPGERGDGGYCVPLFRYLDSTGTEFIPSTPVTGNSISAVSIVLSATYADQPAPVSRSRTVTPNSYQPQVIIDDVATPTCPSGLTRTLSGSDVTLSWPPVPDATQYRIVRTENGATATIATLSVAAMPSNANPSYVDNISGLSATSIAYTVLPTVDGTEASGCPQVLLSVQVSTVTPTISVVPGSGAGWEGARDDDTSGMTDASLEASWPAVPGANAYEAEIREIDPSDDTNILTGWAPFGYDGVTAGSNVVSGLSVTTDTFDGNPLYSRAFQVRIRAVSDSGSSAWMYCYMEPASGVAGECSTYPGNSLPNSGISGYLVMPAPGIVEVTDVARSYAAGNVDLTWGVSADYSDPMFNADSVRYRVQVDQHNGTDNTVSYSAADYSDVYAATTATTGTGSVNAGDWSDFRLLRCNNINPYVTAYDATLDQCGPSSRVWSALGMPSVPGIAATVDSGADENTVRWGKNGAIGTNTNERVNFYDVAKQQGGGSGSSVASGNTVSAQDSVTNASKSSPWQDQVSNTVAVDGPLRQGDFSRYAARAGNTTVNNAATASWLAGVTGEAGQGTGVESWSNWSSDTGRYWQNIGQPAMSSWDTWESVGASFSGTNGGVYISPLNTVTNRQIGRYNNTEGAGTWWVNATSHTWWDDGSSGDSSVNTVKPQTSQTLSVRIVTTYAGSGTSTATRSVDYPPVPNAPSVNVSLDSVTSTGLPRIERVWNDSDSPVSTNYLAWSVGSGFSGASQNGSSLTTGSWGTTYYGYARAAHTYRLYTWGYTATGSDSYTASASATFGGNGCPNIMWNGVTYSTWATMSPAWWSGASTCDRTITAGSSVDVELAAYYEAQITTVECPDIAALGNPLPLYCTNVAYRTTFEIPNRMTASAFTRTGDTIGTVRFTFGASLINTAGVSGYGWVSGPTLSSPTYGAFTSVVPGGGGSYGASYAVCGVSVACG